MKSKMIESAGGGSGFSIMPIICLSIFAVAIAVLFGIFITMRRILEVQEGILDYINAKGNEEDEHLAGMSQG
jgi:hypothetical protein